MAFCFRPARALAYVKFNTAPRARHLDASAAQQFLCEASRDAIEQFREHFLIGSFGGHPDSLTRLAQAPKRT